MFMAHLRVGDEKVREREREREMRKLFTRVKNAVVKKNTGQPFTTLLSSVAKSLAKYFCLVNNLPMTNLLG